MLFAEKKGATVDAVTGAFKTGAKTGSIIGDEMTLQSGGEDVTEFLFNQTDSRNDVSVATVDTTNNSERFSSTNVLVNGTQALRVSQAFVLHTKDKK